VLGLVDAGVGELLEIVGVIVDYIEEDAFDLGSDCGGVCGKLEERMRKIESKSLECIWKILLCIFLWDFVQIRFSDS